MENNNINETHKKLTEILFHDQNLTKEQWKYPRNIHIYLAGIAVTN